MRRDPVGGRSPVRIFVLFPNSEPLSNRLTAQAGPGIKTTQVFSGTDSFSLGGWFRAQQEVRQPKRASDCSEDSARDVQQDQGRMDQLFAKKTCAQVLQSVDKSNPVATGTPLFTTVSFSRHRSVFVFKGVLLVVLLRAGGVAQTDRFCFNSGSTTIGWI